MKYLVVIVMLLLTTYVGAGEDHFCRVEIYYFGFDIERITGIHESQIEELGCHYKATKKKMEESLTLLDDEKVDYEPLNVRAEIRMGGRSYFVDRDGNVRQGSSYYLLDKEMFVSSITLATPCN